MTITSLTFFLFVLAVIVVYYIVPKKYRWIILLLASLAFYAIVCFKYYPFIIFTIITTWLGALWLKKETDSGQKILKAHKEEWDKSTKKEFKHKTTIHKRLILTLILVLNFVILGVLKYYNFLAEWAGGLLGTDVALISILLPLGISFYTFQSMGYIIDVYWGNVEPEKNIAKFALFVTFFPQIVQGPISLYKELSPQLLEGHDLKYENLKYGFQLFLWGLFKKLVIADRLVVAINYLLPIKNEHSNIVSLAIVLIYAAQLYADFSGGIDIIRGVAQMLGIDLAENFRRPYFSKSVAEFWRRWHITLGRWLKNYLFYPIALSKAFLRFGTWISKHGRKGDKELPDDSLWGGYTFLEHLGRVLPGCIATLLTFFIIGMWHGANWRYAGFGFWNGLMIFIAMLLEPFSRWLIKKIGINSKARWWHIWQIVRTFVIILIGFVFDLGYDFKDSIYMLGCCLKPGIGKDINMEFISQIGLDRSDLFVIVSGLIVIFIISLYQERHKDGIREGLYKRRPWLSWVLTFICLFAVIFMGMYGPGISANEFVYMQF